MLLTDSSLLWTIDLGATDHVTRDRAVYVEYLEFQWEPDGYIWVIIIKLASKGLALAS